MGLPDAGDYTLGGDGEGGVEGGCIFALQNAHPAYSMGEGDAKFGGRFSDDVGGPLFVTGFDGRKYPADGDGFDAFSLHLQHGVSNLFRVQGRNLPPVELVASVGHVAAAADGVLKRIRPIAEGGQEGGGGEAQTQHGGLGQPPLLQQGVGEVGRAQHHRRRLRVTACIAHDGPDRRFDAGGYVGAGGDFGLGQKFFSLHDNGVGIGAANVYANSSQHQGRSFRCW